MDLVMQPGWWELVPKRKGVLRVVGRQLKKLTVQHNAKRSRSSRIIKPVVALYFSAPNTRTAPQTTLDHLLVFLPSCVLILLIYNPSSCISIATGFLHFPASCRRYLRKLSTFRLKLHPPASKTIPTEPLHSSRPSSGYPFEFNLNRLRT
jgi:hypothetical protein